MNNIDSWKKNLKVGDKIDALDSNSSNEQYPIYTFSEPNMHTVIILKVTGSKGSSKLIRCWEVLLK